MIKSAEDRGRIFAGNYYLPHIVRVADEEEPATRLEEVYLISSRNLSHVQCAVTKCVYHHVTLKSPPSSPDGIRSFLKQQSGLVPSAADKLYQLFCRPETILGGNTSSLGGYLSTSTRCLLNGPDKNNKDQTFILVPPYLTHSTLFWRLNRNSFGLTTG